MFDEVITLIHKTASEELDEYGDRIQTEEKNEIFADMMSIGIQEFYQAQTSDYKPEIKFKIQDYMDYDQQEYVQYEEMLYKVLRTYRIKGSTELEITCYGGVRNAIAKVSNENN